ncbi:unnamed protein product [Orchesella dallaii]|uniref:Gustatory receptor n=1 Tax=Orchesella dallaii TaxID=48710 RepID=A0ABP1QK42_9HEXA
MEARRATEFGQKTWKQTHIFQSLSIELSSPSYFEYFITSYNFIFLIPFRLRKSEENSIVCVKNIFHQIFCAVLLICNKAWAIYNFLNSINVNIYKEPFQLFLVVINITAFFLPVVFFKVFWKRSEEVSKFANLSKTNFLMYKNKLFSAISTIWPFLLNALFIYHLRSALTFQAQDTWYMYLLQATQHVGLLVGIMLSNFVDTYVALLAISGYDIVRKTVTGLEYLRKSSNAKKQWQNGDFSNLIDIAERLETFFDSLNSIGSPIILNWFCILVTWASHKLLDSLPGSSRDFAGSEVTLWSSWINMLNYWLYFGMYILTLVLCAETKRECDNIHRTIKQIVVQYDPNLMYGKGVLLRIKLAFDNVGIHGGYFFKFSYSFIGSAAGLVVAYTFLALQLQLSV